MVEVKYYGHSFFEIKFSNCNVLLDPYIYTSSSDPMFKRLLPVKVDESKLKNIGLISKETKILEGNINPALEITLNVVEDKNLENEKNIIKIPKKRRMNNVG